MITIRLATLDDLDQLIHLRILMQTEVNEAPLDRVPPDYAEKAKKYFTKSLKEKTYIGIVAEHENTLVAACGLVLYEKPPGIFAKSNVHGYVSNVYTLPEWRRRGIGHRMMDRMIEEARKAGAEKLQLGATSDGRNVYGKVGFKNPAFQYMELKL